MLSALGAASDALLALLLPSEALRLTLASSDAASFAPLVARRRAASLRDTNGWNLVNYARYAEPQDLDFAWSLLARGSPHSSVTDLEFASQALAAALETAGRLQHRPKRRAGYLALVRMLASTRMGWSSDSWPAAGNYKLQAVTRPLLYIPMAHGDRPAFSALLEARADPCAVDSAGESLLCHGLRNVICLGEGAREMFDLCLIHCRKHAVPMGLRDLARHHLRTAVAYAIAKREASLQLPDLEQQEGLSTAASASSFWWSGGRGVRLCRRLFVEVERTAAGCCPKPPRPARCFVLRGDEISA
eukprot:TRINITY_DN91567_c0_g1_i1.p1 TRINITY_DN91567_c0_g1~~TRINITY_DN91567_c0_g1_i1.p1  ORF type:complete len:303 (-),score=50.60 TRINITY_DN91567_c0_g1_i1:299-1207(-)